MNIPIANQITPSRTARPPCDCGAPEHQCHWWGETFTEGGRRWLCTHCAIAAGFHPTDPRSAPTASRFNVLFPQYAHDLNWQAFDVHDDGSMDTVITRQEKDGNVYLVATIHRGALREDQAFAARLMQLAPALLDELRLVRDNIMDENNRSRLSRETINYIISRTDELITKLTEPIEIATTNPDPTKQHGSHP